MSLPPSIVQLREHLTKIHDRVESPSVLQFHVPELDASLADFGLRVNALHEISSVGSDWGNDAAAVLFAAAIAARTKGIVLWALRSRDLFAPGLYQVGLDHKRVIFAEAHDDNELLAIVEEGLRYRALSAVIGEPRRVHMAQSRRLQLAAEGGATVALLLRRPVRNGADPLLAPSAAVSRWRISHTPSAPTPWNGLGRACWRVECARQRGGNAFELTMEGADETGCLALPARMVDRSHTQDRTPIQALG